MEGISDISTGLSSKFAKLKPNRRLGMTQHILTSGKGLQCSRWLPAEEPVTARHFLPAPCLKSLGRGLLAGFSNFSYVFLARVHIWLSFSLVWIFAFKDKMEIYSHFSPVLKRLCCKTCIWLHFSPDMGFASNDKNGTQPTKIYE